MAFSSRGESYVLGGTGHEHGRLIRQARIFKPFTEHLFRNAGVARGQRVLDIGSGVGDIAMLVAELVGPTGEVVGVERDANTLAKARSRVAEAQLRNVSFVELDVSRAMSEVNSKLFDVVVGRLILEFLPDPGAVLRSLSKLARPWVTLALVPHLPKINGVIWEPACGGGKMVVALRQARFDVIGSDLAVLDELSCQSVRRVGDDRADAARRWKVMQKIHAAREAEVAPTPAEARFL